ncbi:MAG: thiamine-phosphate kinase [Actinobacteria bacterium]|nr:thiamine-phosphate kinase [Actinomycetota bacterium]
MSEDYRRPVGRGERAFIGRLRARLAAAPPGQTWAGDDAAALAGGLLLATDVLVAGVHFDLAWSSPADVGWKALAVNLSDLAAMGGSASAAVVALVVPDGVPGMADGVMDGLLEAGAEFSCPVVGGDTTTGGVLVVSVTVVGSAPPGGPVLRSGAQVGDAVFVTGTLGGAKAALDALRRGERVTDELFARLRRPRPRLAEGAAAASGGATSMIDVSDGLGVDLGHVCDESGVGVRIDAAAIPVAAGASLDDALAGGDDYELCLTAPDSPALAEAFSRAGLPAPVRIGDVIRSPERVVVGADLTEASLDGLGWEHPI